MPFRTILLKTINKMVYTKRAVVFRSSFCVGKRTEEIKCILISQKKENSLFHRLIHRLLITLK